MKTRTKVCWLLAALMVLAVNISYIQPMFCEEMQKAKLGENPILRDVFTADPAPMVYNDTVYLYTGHDQAKGEEMFTMWEWLCFSSKDMKTWTAHGPIMRVTDFKWAVRDAWAGQVVERNGKFYFYAPVQHDNTHPGKAIGVAVSESPTGPFVDARGSALVTDDTTPSPNGWDDFDPTVFIDDDGTAWLAWGNPNCYLVKLKPNMIEFDGPIQKIHLPNYTEGPWLHKRGNLYYLTYAAFAHQNMWEKICYATAPKITGPWTYRGIITDQAENSYTIHPGIIEYHGQWYFFYHNAVLTLKGEKGAIGRRSVCLEYLYYNPDGTILPIKQTLEGVTVPPKTSTYVEAQNPNIRHIFTADPTLLPPIPAVPQPLAEDSMPMGDWKSFPEMKLDIPIAPGPFEPTWESIEKNYPGEPAWLREAKFGIWVHFGPQSAGESGDWYARNLYKPGKRAYDNHLKRYGHPSEVGYKDVLRNWNPTKLDPAKLTKIYEDAGARFLMIQGVHHDNYDLWNSKYHPWNSVNIGPKRDLLGEWAKACRANNMRFGVTFHHEYTWWWWQTAFGSDNEGDKKGVPYDGNLTLADGKGKWWEGFDPRLLYGINLREYKGVARASYTDWSPAPAGIFKNHLDYAKWYATQWALRMMDVVEHYDPDFIYTDGTVQGPFTGNGTGTGIKADAMQRVMADYYNRTLQRRGEVNTFSIVKFRHKTNGTVNTEEFGVPANIKTDQPWIAEAPVGDWFYAPDFTYDAGMMIRYIIEAIARNGNAALCISLLPDGSLNEASEKMLKEVGVWMRRNGEAVYGSHAWKIPGEGELVDGKLKQLPGGALRQKHADFKFDAQDFRFTVGKNNALYVFCMTVPAPGTQLKIKSLGTDAKNLVQSVKTVKLLGHSGKLQWKQEADGLAITCPAEMPFATSIVFKIESSISDLVVTVTQNAGCDPTNWPGTPILSTTTNPYYIATEGVSFNHGAGVTNISQTFTVAANSQLHRIALFAGDGFGTGPGNTVTLALYDLGLQEASSLNSYSAETNLFGSGKGLQIAYEPQAPGLLLFDFAGSNQVILKAGHVYSFELQGIRESAPLFWRRTKKDTYQDGAACSNRAVIEEKSNKCDFAMAVYGTSVLK